MKLGEEYKSTNDLLDFSELPDVLPIQPKESFIDLDYSKLIYNRKQNAADPYDGDTDEENSRLLNFHNHLND